MVFARESAKNPISPREIISREACKRLPLILKKIPKLSERGVYATHSDIWSYLRKEISLFRN